MQSYETRSRKNLTSLFFLITPCGLEKTGFIFITKMITHTYETKSCNLICSFIKTALRTNVPKVIELYKMSSTNTWNLFAANNYLSKGRTKNSITVLRKHHPLTQIRRLAFQFFFCKMAHITRTRNLPLSPYPNHLQSSAEPRS